MQVRNSARSTKLKYVTESDMKSKLLTEIQLLRITFDTIC